MANHLMVYVVKYILEYKNKKKWKHKTKVFLVIKILFTILQKHYDFN